MASIAPDRSGGAFLRWVRALRRRSAVRIAEPAVTLTDYALALEAAYFAAALLNDRRRADSLRVAGACFFGAAALATFTGGTVHGFFPDARHPLHRALWATTLAAVGGGSLAAWALGTGLSCPPRVARNITLGAAHQYGTYVAAIVGGERRFAFAVASYLPATLFLLGVFAIRFARDRGVASGLGLSGVALTLVAAGIQQGRIALHPRYCDHNTLYHLVQGVALLLFYRGLRALR